MADAGAKRRDAGPVDAGAIVAPVTQGAQPVEAEPAAPTATVPSAPLAPPAAQPSAEGPAAPLPATQAEIPAAPPPKGYDVALGDQKVAKLFDSVDGVDAATRARLASKALIALAKQEPLPEIEVLAQAPGAVIYAGRKPLLQLTGTDAELAEETTVKAYAQDVASDIRFALAAEQRRGEIANTVLSVSLVVFFGLMAFFLMGRVSRWTKIAHDWVERHGDRLRLSIRDVEILGTEAVQSASVTAIGLLRWLGQIAIAYVWLIVSLSLFSATRGYTEELTGVFVAPISELTTRVASSLPVFVVAAIAGLAVFVLVRFVELFFASVAKREATVSWVTPDLAWPTSVLLRLGIVLTALLFIAPLVTGNEDGTLPRVGMVITLTLGLSCTPVVASALVGAVVVFGRDVRIGDYVAVGELIGRVRKLTLAGMHVDTEQGYGVHLPALSLLRTPLRMLGRAPLIQVEVVLSEAREPVHHLLEQAAGELSDEVVVELYEQTPTSRRYRISARCGSLADRALLVSKLSAALTREGFVGSVCALGYGK